MYDAAIIGSGPAGLSAALNLKLHEKNIIWFGSEGLSAKVEKSERIANYPGNPMVEGPALNVIFRKQIQEAGLVLTDRMVTNISATRKGFLVLGGNDIYDAKTVLLATGSVSAKGFGGEQELLGHGVSYCATCDGFLYKGKTIAVFCGAKRYEHEVEYLANLAAKVYLFAPYEDCGIDLPNVIRPKSGIRAIVGEERVQGVTLADDSLLPLEGVFLLRNAVAPATLLKGLEMDGAHIVVNRQMETGKKGCFAAGDCTGRPYQIAKAVGEGNVAAHAILEYLSELNLKNPGE